MSNRAVGAIIHYAPCLVVVWHELGVMNYGPYRVVVSLDTMQKSYAHLHSTKQLPANPWRL